MCPKNCFTPQNSSAKAGFVLPEKGGALYENHSQGIFFSSGRIYTGSLLFQSINLFTQSELLKPAGNPLQLIRLSSLRDHVGPGRRSVTLGLIDGPVESSHPDFEGITIKNIDSGRAPACQSKDSPACVHGTFIAGILCAGNGSQAPGIYPEAALVTRSLFCEASDLSQCPVVTPQHLAEAVTDVVDAGANIINLSLGLAQSPWSGHATLNKAFDYALRKGVLIVGAGGNQGRIGYNPLFNHPWVIPVAACDVFGNVLPDSNIGKSIGQRGIMAPGKDVISTYSKGGYTKLSGTSIAAPFVSAGIALLWSVFPEASAQQIREAILLEGRGRRTIVPPLLNLAESKAYLSALFANEFST